MLNCLLDIKRVVQKSQIILTNFKNAVTLQKLPWFFFSRKGLHWTLDLRDQGQRLLTVNVVCVVKNSVYVLGTGKTINVSGLVYWRDDGPWFAKWYKYDFNVDSDWFRGLQWLFWVHMKILFYILCALCTLFNSSFSPQICRWHWWFCWSPTHITSHHYVTE